MTYSVYKAQETNNDVNRLREANIHTQCIHNLDSYKYLFKFKQC